MQLTVEKLGPCQARISFNVPASDFQARFKSQLLDLAGKANMKGFRPGKVPVAVVEKQYGEQVRVETKKHFLETAFKQAIEQEKLKPASWPRVIPDQIVFGAEGEFAHSFEVLLRPDIELKSYAGMEIETRKVDVRDEEVEAALADLRRQQSRAEVAGPEGLTADGVAVARVELLYEGRPVLAREGLRLSPKTPLQGVDAAAFEKALTGAHEGESRELGMVFPDPFEQPELAGKSGQCRLTFTQVYSLTPPADEELYKLIGVDSAEALRAKAREHILVAKQEQEDGRIEAELFERLLDMHAMELPEQLVEEQATARLEALKQQLTQQGITAEAAAERAESEKEAARTTSRRALRAMYLVESVGAQEKLQLDQQDYTRELQSIATRNRSTFEEVRDFYNKNQGLREQMALELLERKVRGLLRAKAVLRPSA